jgi:hypothetical protein
MVYSYNPSSLGDWVGGLWSWGQTGQKKESVTWVVQGRSTKPYIHSLVPPKKEQWLLNVLDGGLDSVLQFLIY